MKTVSLGLPLRFFLPHGRGLNMEASCCPAGSYKSCRQSPSQSGHECRQHGGAWGWGDCCRDAGLWGPLDSEACSLASSCVQSGETKKSFSKWRIQSGPRQSVGREAQVCVWSEMKSISAADRGPRWWWVLLRVASGARSVSCHVWTVTSVAFSHQSVLSRGNDGTSLAGGFAVQGLQVLAHRCLELKWEPRLRLDGPPASLAPSLYRGSTSPPTAGLAAGGKHV